MNSTEKFYTLQDKARETLTGDAAALVAEAVLTGQPVDFEQAYSAHCSWRDDETQEEHDELVRVAVEECETLLTELAANDRTRFVFEVFDANERRIGRGESPADAFDDAQCTASLTLDDLKDYCTLVEVEEKYDEDTHEWVEVNNRRM